MAKRAASAVYVYPSRKGWRVEIRSDGKRVTQQVATESEAIAIARAAKRELGGKECPEAIAEFIDDARKRELRVTR